MGNKVENRWIDLDVLPKIEGGPNHGHIDWSKSVGYSVPFIYGEWHKCATIIGYDKIKRCIVIYVDGCTEECGYNIFIEQFVKIKLGELFKTTIRKDAPWMIKYLCDPNDADKYSIKSKIDVNMKCPICGTVRKMSIGQLYYQGFFCHACSNRISYPNKLMRNLLQQLNIAFIDEITGTQKGFEWIGNYRYDFYLTINSQQYFIEMDGGFHDREDVKQRDAIKDMLDKDHNIQMIRIDCRYKSDRLNFIKNNILDSELNKILQLNHANIDWEKCDLDTQHSIVFDVCTMWDTGAMIKDIAKKFDISTNTVTNYLKIGEKYKLCGYTVENSTSRNTDNIKKYVAEHICKPLEVYKDNMLIGVFKSESELSRLSTELLGRSLDFRGISRVCTGERTKYKGYVINHITKEKYIKYKGQQEIPVY